MAGNALCALRNTQVTDTSNFCKNEFNLTGTCNRSSCPLANSQYATVREEKGVISLYTKTVERAHEPARLWERTELSSKYEEALHQINSRLEYWPKFLVHKSKQRLTKLTQLLIRSRRLEKVDRCKIETIPARHAQRDARTERKAQVAARLDKSIENELLERLSAGVYASGYTFSTSKYSPILVEEIAPKLAKKLSARSVQRKGRIQTEIEYEVTSSIDK